MIVNLHKLLDLPVYTESGIKLGKIFDVELDIENHLVLRYLVRPNFISMQHFLIQVTQVKEVTDEKIIVDDSVAPVSLEEKAVSED